MSEAETNMEQLQFEFDFTQTPQPIKNQFINQERCTCAICGREFLYTEYADRKRNQANESWMNYCSREHFIKGFVDTWKNSPHFVDLLHIQGISYEELQKARA